MNGMGVLEVEDGGRACGGGSGVVLVRGVFDIDVCSPVLDVERGAVNGFSG